MNLDSFGTILLAVSAACLLASLGVWGGGRYRVAGPPWWAASYALCIAAWALHGGGGTGRAAGDMVMQLAFVLQAVGFARAAGLDFRLPALAAVASIAPLGGLALAMPASWQAREALASGFYPLALLAALCLLWLALRRGSAFMPRCLLAGLALAALPGTLRFLHALAAGGAWSGDLAGSLAFRLAMVAGLGVLVFCQLRLVKRSLEGRIAGLDATVDQARRDLFATLGQVIESNSLETADHLDRVSACAALLGRHMGLDEAAARQLASAARLHDIGKIGIPQEILGKPGALRAQEFAVVKTHAAIGHGMLSRGQAGLEMAARIALEHHENWDGSGYPRGLSGEAISLEGRIVGLCDVIDALAHRRCYKEAWDAGQILQYLEHESGHKFDPRLVDIVLSRPAEFFAAVRLPVVRPVLAEAMVRGRESVSVAAVRLFGQPRPARSLLQ